MGVIRVLLVDDSPVFLGVLQAALARDADVKVVGTAMSGEEALSAINNLVPHVVVCDVQMPGMSGIDFLKRQMSLRPIPIVVVSSTPGLTLTALQHGAVDFIQKPAAADDKAEFFKRVLATVKMAASANMRAKTAAQPPASATRAPAAPPVAARAYPPDVVVAIGASTGGTDAIATLMRNFPANFPGVLITQHMPAGFTNMYAARLDKECAMQVFEAQDGQRLAPGRVILAAGEHHLRLHRDTQGYYVSSKRGDKVNGHVPSVEVLFNSVAEVAKGRAVGVILTGMGGDGAEGLLHMRREGAYTLGQDKESSVVYGMPAVAFNIGAVAKQLPLSQIAAEVIRAVGEMR